MQIGISCVSKMKSFFYALKEILEIVLVAVIIVVGVRHFLVQPFLVDGYSMEPNFFSGDYLLINELSFRFKEPQRGEVVVFHYPGNKSTYFIKRIIGLPEEKVEIKDGKIFIFNKENSGGFELKEFYLGPENHTSGSKTVSLNKDEYFVLGDNRSKSFDSRQWGSLNRTEIVGSAWLRLWPLDEITAFAKPAY